MIFFSSVMPFSPLAVLILKPVVIDASECADFTSTCIVYSKQHFSPALLGGQIELLLPPTQSPWFCFPGSGQQEPCCSGNFYTSPGCWYNLPALSSQMEWHWQYLVYLAPLPSWAANHCWLSPSLCLLPLHFLSSPQVNKLSLSAKPSQMGACM